MSIRNSREKIKHFLVGESFHELLVVLFIVAAGLFGFSLGQASVLAEQPIVLQQSPDVASGFTVSANSGNMPFVASSSGTTYMPTLCNAAERVNPENRIYFESQDQAERAGYRPSKLCDF